ncbi:hypothetical protein KUCAC02_022380, partial [Chaenocephalus aceratus]
RQKHRAGFPLRAVSEILLTVSGMCGGETSSAQQEQHDMIQGMVQSSFSSPAGAVEVQS